MNAPLITIFTPTYNRAHTLGRVFDSLQAQTSRDFEWLVIDDGSTDGTRELIETWSKSADFPIRYFRQDHAGKHIAHNRALGQARGHFFSCLDSDDALVPNALEKLTLLWNSIPQEQRQEFYSVGGLCCDQSGRIVGDSFPSNPFDTDARELRYTHHIRGEKWGIGLTEILRRFPFPEISGVQFIPEGIVWLEIGKTFRTRYLNEVVRIYYIDDPATGVTLSQRSSWRDHAFGRRQYYIWLLNNDLEYFLLSPVPFLKAAVMLPIVSRFSHRSFRTTLKSLESPSARILLFLALPLALLFYMSNGIRSLISSRIKTENS